MPTNDRIAKGTAGNLTIVAWVVATIVIGAVTAVALLHRSGAVTIDAKSGGNSFSFKVAESRIDFNGLLECLLSEQLSDKCKTLLGQPDAGDGARRRVVRGILQDHGFYYIPSDSAVTALRDIKETENTQAFVQSVRQLLYDLAGPFSRPATFMDASDDRLLLALDDLAERKPSSPLVAKLWEMSLDWKGIFHPRSVNVVIKSDDALKPNVAATCAGSILLEKSAQVLNERSDTGISIVISKSKPCAATSTENLLAGKPTEIWISETDVSALRKNAAPENSKDMKGILVPAPSNFTPRDQ
jgi:hypothetical protein